MSEIQKLVGIDEEDNEDDAEMGVKEEDDEDDDEERNNLATPMIDADAGIISSSSNSQFQSPDLGNQGGSSRRSRPLEEKERTKLRERHRRAITARILAGLRRHGNYNLRVRADINDVISALAREAGWVVLPDGTTFPNRSQGLKSVGTSPAIGTTQSPQMLAPQTPASTVGGISPGHHGPIEYNAGQMKGVFTPSSFPYDLSSNQAALSSSLVGVGAEQLENLPLAGHPMGIGSEKQERDFAGTSFVPVFMMLPLGVINVKCELVDPDNLVKQLRILKSANIDGVMVDCWWGIVEAQAPQEYNWDGYRRLFHIVHELRLRLQVVMSFHECGGNLGDDVCIPLPHWVVEIGRSNPDIYFTDREGRRNPECLSWGIDKERVLRGRTAIEVYFDFMRSFRVEFDEFFKLGIISMIEVGLGPCGDLRYPSYPVKHGWRFPGVGEFQCYDQYMLKSLRKAAEARGHSYWGRGPDNAGSYNSRPYETGFFCDRGDYDGYYGRFFLKWYSQFLVDHADRVLSLAKLAFEGTSIAAKLSGIHWWYRTASHAAELTAGFHNSSNRDGYTAIVAMLKKHEATLNLTYTGVPLLGHHEEFQEALADPDGLVWQVLNAAWEACVPVASVNSFPCHDQEGYNKILGDVKPENNPDSRHFATFTFLRLSPVLMERNNFMQFERFVKRMHGLPVLDQQM